MTTRRFRFNKELGKVVELQVRRAEHFHFVIDDTRDTFESPVTGEKFNSMSAYKRHIKAEGYEITGGDGFTGKGLGDFQASDLTNEAEMRDASLKELNDARYGMMPCTERERETWKEESKMMKGQSNNLMEIQMKGLEERSQKMGIPVSELREGMKKRSC